MGWLVVFTFVIPVVQWLVNKLLTNSEYAGVISSVAVILSISLWLRQGKAISFHTLSFHWKPYFYLVLTVILGLLIFNVLNQPVSKITGQTRSPFEVLDIIVFLPFAEELIFRGAIWSILERFFKADIGRIAVFVGTSLLFGIEHLGYWAQSNWPLPLDAYFHAISMIFAGIFFGFFRYKFGSLTIPILLHMLANDVILLIQ
jgi:membrane protease YdiL (CAAX protease family)